MGKIVHFEITADDTERARKFYEIFGWTTKSADMPGAEYWLVNTGSDEPGTGGAIMPRSYNSQPVIDWVDVDDIDQMIEKVKAAGGTVPGEKREIPGIGFTVYAVDTEGNTFGMIQPAPLAASS